MWLSDYTDAIAAMMKIFGNGCWKSITSGLFGDRFIFTDTSDNKYTYFRHTGRVVQTFDDTWRNPEHFVEISAGTI